jgi:hypothetical protein
MSDSNAFNQVVKIARSPELFIHGGGRLASAAHRANKSVEDSRVYEPRPAVGSLHLNASKSVRADCVNRVASSNVGLQMKCDYPIHVEDDALEKSSEFVDQGPSSEVLHQNVG